MVTIEHWKAKDHEHRTVHGVHWSEAVSCMYYAGRLPPNYPVPATKVNGTVARWLHGYLWMRIIGKL